MKLNQSGINLIKSFEKCRLVAYQEQGDIPTIGWGNTFYKDGSKVKLGDEITQQEADELFDYWLERDYVPSVERALKVELNENQFSALVSYRYNVSPKSFIESELLGLINRYKNHASLIESVWKTTNIRKGSRFERGLTRRRIAEAKLYLTPI